MSLKVKTITGVKWTTISTAVITLLQIVQLAIVARFVEPRDFGLMAIVMVVMGFVSAFSDLGISNAIIHRQNITKEELSSLYWLNVIAGVCMFLIVSFLSPFIAKFYKEPQLTILIIMLASTFIFQSFSQQYSMLWQKELRFKEIARIEILNKIFSLMFTAYLAYIGLGVYALAFGAILGSIVQTIQYLYLGLKEYRPKLRFCFNEIKPFLSFGMYQMGERTMNYFIYQFDTILIGKLLGMEALGIYSVAKQLVMRPAMIFNPIVTRVTFPAMSKIQNDVPKLREVYLKTINYLSSVNFPVYAFIFVFAHDIVITLFGKKWLEAATIVQILSIWAAWRSTGNPIGSLLLARGRADLGFWWVFGVFLYMPIGITIASYWGIVGIAIGLNVIMGTLVYPAWRFLVNPLCGAGFIEYHKKILEPAFIAIVAGAVSYIFSIYIYGAYGVIVKLIMGSIIILMVALVLNYLINRQFLLELKEVIKV